MHFLLAITLASHRPTATGPYDWHIPCGRWQERAVEIMADANLPDADKRFLVNYLRGKVSGECPYPAGTKTTKERTLKSNYFRSTTMTARIYRNAPYTRSEELLSEAPRELVYRGVPYVRKNDGTVSSDATLVYRGHAYNNLSRLKRVLDKAERLTAARNAMARM